MRYLDRFFQPDNWQEDNFTSAQGKKIRYGHAEPTAEKRGTVIITTGYADFMESYYETVHEYLDRGYAVWMMDWAGQGGSEKKRDDTTKAQLVSDHVNDLYKFRHDIVKPVEDKPVFMSTHSMGGQIALQYLMQNEKDFDFAILAAPLVDFDIKGTSRSVLESAFKAAVDMGLGNQTISGGRKGITRQIMAERKKLKKEDPVRMDLHRTFFMMNQQLRAEDPTFGLIDSLFEATNKLNEEKALKAIKSHILFGVAGKDDIVDNESIYNAIEHIPNAVFGVIDEATHDMWQERQKYRLEWWGVVDCFLKEQHARLEPKSPRANDNDASEIKPPGMMPDKQPETRMAPQKPKGPFLA